MSIRAVACIILLASTVFAFASNPVFGDWITPDHSIVHIAPCAADKGAGSGTVCLTVVKVDPRIKPGKDGKITDQENPDPALRSRPICGLVIGSGFRPSSPTELTGGKLYDPNSGHTYSGNIASSGDTLHLHGYIGVSLFGRTETWHRSATVTPCS